MSYNVTDFLWESELSGAPDRECITDVMFIIVSKQTVDRGTLHRTVIAPQRCS